MTNWWTIAFSCRYFPVQSGANRRVEMDRSQKNAPKWTITLHHTWCLCCHKYYILIVVCRPERWLFALFWSDVAVVSVSWQHIKWIQGGSQSHSMSIESFHHCSIIHLFTVDLHIHYNKASEWYFITFNLILTTDSIMINRQYSAVIQP